MKNIKWNKPIEEALGMKSIKLFDDKYEKVMAFSLAYQLFLLFMASMILDGGQITQFMLVSMITFWGSVIVLVFRNRWKPSVIDLLYIKWGFFPILISVPFIMELIWHIRGV